MRRLSLAFIASTALSLGCAQIASAADMAVRAAPSSLITASAYSWNGLYLGGNIGGLSGTKNWSVTGTGIPLGSSSPSGAIGGGQIGYNWQMSALVFGIQADYDWSGASGSNADLVIVANTNRSRIKSLASVTGRIGFAMDRALLYVKGGGAWARDDYDSFVTATGVAVANASQSRSGWTLGGGLEYAFLGTWSGFIEYDYYGFGTRALGFATPAGLPFGTFDIRQTVSVIKGGINYRFGW
jgi:outer membrane immunogenic protein